jgi:hypothetical protein
MSLYIIIWEPGKKEINYLKNYTFFYFMLCDVKTYL